MEKIIPDIRKRAEVTMVGTPLTHERFLRRHRGSYGPAIQAGKGLFPGELYHGWSKRPDMRCVSPCCTRRDTCAAVAHSASLGPASALRTHPVGPVTG